MFDHLLKRLVDVGAAIIVVVIFWCLAYSVTVDFFAHDARRIGVVSESGVPFAELKAWRTVDSTGRPPGESRVNRVNAQGDLLIRRENLSPGACAWLEVSEDTGQTWKPETVAGCPIVQEAGVPLLPESEGVSGATR